MQSLNTVLPTTSKRSTSSSSDTAEAAATLAVLAADQPNTSMQISASSAEPVSEHAMDALWTIWKPRRARAPASGTKWDGPSISAGPSGTAIVLGGGRECMGGTLGYAGLRVRDGWRC